MAWPEPVGVVTWMGRDILESRSTLCWSRHHPQFARAWRWLKVKLFFDDSEFEAQFARTVGTWTVQPVSARRWPSSMT